jgi:hypothetical protein
MKFILKISLASLVLFACSSIKVYSDYDKTYDFTQVKTAQYFGWADGTDKILSPFDKERVEKAFGAEFKSRGITFTQSETSDIIVSLHIVTEQKTQTTATTTGMGGYGGYGYGGYYGYGPGYGYGTGYATTTYSTYDYTVGTLLVSVYDTKTKMLVWESAAQGTIEKDAKNREKNINYAVKSIMYKYPVKPTTTK